MKPEIRILIAEDDTEDFELFKAALEKTSYKFHLMRAKHGDELMRCLRDQAVPDILFLDLNMPCKDGHQCISEIREDRALDSLPVIMYSSLFDPNVIDKCFKARSNFYAVKPNTIDDLQRIIENVLSIEWKASLYYPARDKFVLRGQ